MKSFMFILLLVFISFRSFAQDISKITELDDIVSETSGLIYVNDRLITHNDSGGMNALYEVNEQNGGIVRTVNVENATNVDWEDICQDDDHIYIGDIGNNNGNRTNLRIYKVLKSDYLNSEQVTAEIINFSYKDQTDFTSANNNTNFDAEGLISYGDNLFIFTKNWVDQRSNIYRLSKLAGTYEIVKTDEFNAEGLITGAVYNPLSDKVILSGYGGLSAFAIELRGFSGGKFSNGVIDKYALGIPLTESFQAEGIAYKNATLHYVSTEKNTLGNPSLYSLNSATLGLEDIELQQQLVYPNPGQTNLTIGRSEELDKIEIYDASGKRLYEVSPVVPEKLDISKLSKGIYIMKMYAGQRQSSLKFIKQ